MSHIRTSVLFSEYKNVLYSLSYGVFFFSTNWINPRLGFNYGRGAKTLNIGTFKYFTYNNNIIYCLFIQLRVLPYLRSALFIIHSYRTINCFSDVSCLFLYAARPLAPKKNSTRGGAVHWCKTKVGRQYCAQIRFLLYTYLYYKVQAFVVLFNTRIYVKVSENISECCVRTVFC